MWSGQCRVVVKTGDNLVIRFLEPNGDLYVESDPIALRELTDEAPLDRYLEKVVDSSRYFVCKLKAPNGRIIPLGFGFRERSDSFDLTASIMDYVTQINRHAKWGGGVASSLDADGATEDNEAPGPVDDERYVLADDEMLSTNNGRVVKQEKEVTPDLSAFTLAPPPD